MAGRAKFILIALIFLFGIDLHAQGIPYQLNPPAPNARVQFCPVPDGGYPCPTLTTVYSDSATTQVINQPITTGSSGNLLVYFPGATSSVTVQLLGQGYGPQNRFVVALGGGGVLGQFSVKTYGAVGDARKTFNATTTNLSSTITDTANSPWLATDANKKIFCIGAGGNSPLSVTTATISAVNSTSSISVAPAIGNGNAQINSYCTWYTQKDTAAFQAAYTAAVSSVTNASGAVTSYSGQVYCPPGGYVVDRPFFIQKSTTLGLGASFIGSGMFSCTIYISPDIAATNSATMIDSEANLGAIFSGFTVDCSIANLSVAGQGFRLINNLRQQLSNIYIKGCGNSGDGGGAIISLSGGQDTIIDQVFFDGNFTVANGSNETAMKISNGSAGVHVRNFHSVNPGQFPLIIDHSCGGTDHGSNRSTTSAGCLFENSLIDEGGNPTISVIASSPNFVGGVAFMGSPHILEVDGTSTVYLTDFNMVPFGGSCGGVNNNAISIASGGYVYATGSTISGCGTAVAVTGPAGATFVDDGGNLIENCTAGTCTPVTAANYGTLGFGGGIVPKATVTHTPNTCYAASGTLVQSQNLCNFLDDQNYQVINITAQSGGASPVNSSCTVAPVVTMSDGTRTATLTLTTGKTAWNSSVDAAAVGSIFATGTTLTISVGTFTCATPPANLSVSYVLQSVLNQ